MAYVFLIKDYGICFVLHYRLTPFPGVVRLVIEVGKLMIVKFRAYESSIKGYLIKVV